MLYGNQILLRRISATDRADRSVALRALVALLVIALIPSFAAAGAVLEPGSGFGSEGIPVARIGKGPGADAKAIARWDLVPFDRVTSTRNVGVIAFHINGIDRVEFAVNGGSWTAVRQMALNPQTQVVEYFAVIDPARFNQGGALELRAIAYPTSGVPRALEPITFRIETDEAAGQVRYVDPAGSDDTGDGSPAHPFATIGKAAKSLGGAADGGVIYLLPGRHSFAAGLTATTEQTFLSIAAAPDVSRDQVIITAGGRLNASKVHLKGLTLQGASMSSKARLDPIIWFDDCALRGGGRLDDVTFARPTFWTGGIYATHCTIESVSDGLKSAVLQRNVQIRNILSDAFTNCDMIVNCTVDGIDKSGTKAHPDIVQWDTKNALDNAIVYGLRATNFAAQGIFVSGPGSLQNIACVDVNLEMDPRHYYSQWGKAVDHLLLWRVSIANRAFLFRTLELTNVSIRDCSFHELKGLEGLPQVVAQMSDNHFVTGRTWGERAALGTLPNEN